MPLYCRICKNPFPIICGTSAGAINALYLAAHLGEFNQAAQELAAIWRKLQIQQVYHCGWQDLLFGLTRVGASLFNRGKGVNKPLALLDNSPLRELLGNLVAFEQLNVRIKRGELEAVSVTALGYHSGDSVTFFQGAPHLQGWRQRAAWGRLAY